MNNLALILAAAACCAAAFPAQARIAQTLSHPDPLAAPAEQAPTNPLVSGTDVRTAARIAALRARSPNQYRPTVKCESDVAMGENAAGPAKGYSQAGTYVGNLTVLAGGICPADRRGRR